MAISDMVAEHLTLFYMMMIILVKILGLVSGRDFGGGFVLVVSTAVVVTVLVGSLMWDISHKPRYVVNQDDEDKEPDQICRGGICWHGVAVKSPASKLRFRIPQHRQI